MTGLPDVTVLLDDGTGTYPVDISDYVERQESVELSGFGRTDEFQQAQASTLTFVLDNTSGTFSGTGAGWDTTPWDSGMWDGGIPLAPGMGIRVSETIGATTQNLFTGQIANLDLGWPGGSEAYSLIGVTAADPLAPLGRRILRSMIEEQILLESPSAYYTLGEIEGSTSAGDTSGNQRAPLTAAGTGAAPVFGSVAGPFDSGTGVTLAGGQWLEATTASDCLGASAWSMVCWFNTTTTPAVAMTLLWVTNAAGTAGVPLAIDSAGHVIFSSLSSSFSVTDGAVHSVAVAWDGTVLHLLVDESSTTAFLFTVSGAGLDRVVVGGQAPLASAFTGTISHVALYDHFISPLGHPNTGPYTERADARLSRLASYAGLTATAVDPSGQYMPDQATNGQSLFQAMQDVATAEGGVLFADGDGNLVLQGRYHRSLKTAADLTLDSQDQSVDTAITVDTQQLINQVTVTRIGGADQVVTDGAGDYPTSYELAVLTDADALANAQWTVEKHKTVSPRIGSVTVNLHESPNAEDIISAGIGDRIALANMPDQIWGDIGDLTIEGWSETITHQSWTRTLNLLPFELSRVAIWDDPGSLWDDAPWGY